MKTGQTIELNVGKSTVMDWHPNRKSIEDFCIQIETEKVLPERRTLKRTTNEMVDALWLWFLQEGRRGTPTGIGQNNMNICEK